MMKLFLERLTDRTTQEVLEILQRFLNTRKMLWDMQFYDLTFDVAVTDQPFAHNLRAVPKDVIQTRKTGAGDVTFEYAAFTDRFIFISTTGPCNVRFFAGTYKEE